MKVTLVIPFRFATAQPGHRDFKLRLNTGLGERIAVIAQAKTLIAKEQVKIEPIPGFRAHRRDETFGFEQLLQSRQSGPDASLTCS